jgi:tetratricopeptide (TPR) repeat protein
MKFFVLSLLLACAAATIPAQKIAPKTTPRAKRSAKDPDVPARARLAATPARTRLSESVRWDQTAALTDNAEKLKALNKFIDDFPRSEHIAEARTMVVRAEIALGNDAISSGDMAAAAKNFLNAAADAPVPIPADMFSELARLPANLYFRGTRDVALEIAEALEKKAAGDAVQLLGIAQFYLSIESGSDARRLAEAAIAAKPDSADAYQTLGLADRMDFELEASAAAYAKALELQRDSTTARRGLAEMDRSLGKADEAAELYREILASDSSNLPARTGLILAMFEGGHRAEAEAELATSLEANPGNVMLLAGAAYWYAVHDEGGKAVTFAQKAIESDPRFIWSHIALARGLLAQKKAVEAEKVLLAARRYGNFPTLDYEIASARLAAGLYRDAADELVKSFEIKDGEIRASLGGRVTRSSKNFTELVGFERRASIFAPTAADDPQSAAQLAALLQLRQQLDGPQPDPDAVGRSVDEFVRGDDGMKVHRQLYAASALLEKRTALPKVLELAKAAPRVLDAGLKVPDAVTPVLAGELYESRRIALARGEFINTPDVPAQTLSAILRGRIEDLTGWALYESNDAEGALLHLRRATSVLPADSAWWRSANWRLGNAFALAGKEADALEAYIKTYKAGAPDPVRYHVIAGLYKRVNGSTDGLEERIGPDPAPAVAQVTATPTPTPEVSAETPTPVPAAIAENASAGSPPAEIKADVTPSASPQTSTSVEPAVVSATPSAEPSATASPSETPRVSESSPTPDVTPVTMTGPKGEAKAKPTPESAKQDLFAPVIITIPPPAADKPGSRTAGQKPSPTPEGTPVAEATANPDKEAPAETASPTPDATPGAEPAATPASAPDEGAGTGESGSRPRVAEHRPSATPEMKPCTLLTSEDTVSLKSGGGDLAITLRREHDDEDLEELTAVSTSPQNVSVRREMIEGMTARALFVVRSISSKTGIYQVRFEMPCGKKEIVVKVR